MSDEYTSFLDLNLSDVPEPRIVDGGREYKLKIENVEIKESRGEKTAGQKMLSIRLSIVDEPDTQGVFENIMLPSDQMDDDQNNQRRRQLKRLVEAIGWDASRGFNIDELVGQTFWAVLDAEESDQYGKQNRVKRYMAPQSES